MTRGGRAFIEHVLSRADDESDAVGIRIGALPEPLCTADRGGGAAIDPQLHVLHDVNAPADL